MRTINPFRLLAVAGSALVLGLGVLAPAASAGTGVALSFSGSRTIEGDWATVNAPAAIRLSAPINESVDIYYQFNSFAGCTAIPDVDYLMTVSKVTFLPGQTTKFVSAQVIGDLTKEDSECFQIKLVSIYGAGADQITSWEQSALMNIIDEDSMLVIGS